MPGCSETYDAVLGAAADLPPQIRDAIAAPEAIYAPPAFRAATARERFRRTSRVFEEKAVGGECGTPFWRQFDCIAEGLGLAGRGAIAWSNCCRVQRVEPCGESYSLDAGDPLYRDFGQTRSPVEARAGLTEVMRDMAVRV